MKITSPELLAPRTISIRSGSFTASAAAIIGAVPTPPPTQRILPSGIVQPLPYGPLIPILSPTFKEEIADVASPIFLTVMPPER